MRRSQAGLVAAASIAVVALAAPSLPLAHAAQTQEDQPLEAAGRAATQLTFSGSLEVTWSDDSGEHRQSLSVQGADGAVVVRGSNEVMASRQQRKARKPSAVRRALEAARFQQRERVVFFSIEQQPIDLERIQHAVAELSERHA